MYNEKIIGSVEPKENGLVGGYDVAIINGAKLVNVMKKRMEKGEKAANNNLQRDPYEPNGNPIANGVIESGIMPVWTVVMALSGELAVDENGEFRIPETDEECEKHWPDIQVMDGNNRVLSEAEIVKALGYGVDITVQILNNPDEYLVGYHFNVMNTARKPVDQDLCFTIQYNLDILPAHKKEVYEHLVRARGDYTHALYKRIKTDDKRGGFSIKTMVEYMVNDSIDVIEVLSKRYKSPAKRYEAIKNYWKIVEIENAHDCTGGKVIGEDGRVKRMTAQRAAVTGAELANFCQILIDNEKRISAANLKELYNLWVHDVMKTDHILRSDNGTVVYKTKDGKKIAATTDRWNGRNRAFAAIQTDYDMLTMAFNKNLVAERV